MQCDYFGLCGSCKLYEMSYEEQLKEKEERLSELLSPFFDGAISSFGSPSEHFRARCELKIFREGERVSLGMSSVEKQTIPIANCKIVARSIYEKIPPLVEAINSDDMLKQRIYSIDFLSSTNGEVLVNIIYHKKLDDAWKERAEELAKRLGIKIVGRSRKQKLIIGEEYVTDTINVRAENYQMRKYEGAFSQPNSFMSEKMLGWAVESSKEFSGDLLEMYCGNGNFTLPLSKNFDKVFATEISKSAIKTVTENCEQNGIKNITFARLSGEECMEALSGGRSFFRLKDVDLQSYDFRSVFVDPPRAGLGEDVARFIARFDNILYISCNPETLVDDLGILKETHVVKKAAMFDQFPWTHHLESGVVLQKKAQ